MFSSQRKSNNYGDIKSGETLFDFLKRKKKFALDQSFSKSRCKENINQNRQSIAESYSPRKKCEETYRDAMRQSSYNYQTTRRNQHISTTPKRVTFSEVQNKKPQTGRSSFVQMISPIRRKNNVEANTSAEIPALSKSRGRQRERQKQNTQQVFHRKNLNKSVGIIKSTLQKLINTGKSLKQKSHTLLIELKPLLKFIEEGDNRNFARRADDAKLKLRTFEHLFKQFDIENGNQLMEQFHRTLSEHIISMQGNIRSNYEKDQLSALKKIKIQKDNKIQQLTIKNQKLEKQLQVLSRKLDRSQKSVNKLQRNCEDESQNYTKTISTKISDYQTRIAQYQAQISQLAIELDNSKLVQKRMQKQLKDLKYLKQEAQKRFVQENMKIKSDKEELLINQIEMLKGQFKNDMGQLTSLYASKQKQQFDVINELKRQVGELHEQRKCDQDIYNRILEQNSSFKPQIDKFKKQNECLVTDLHRMNEELYQHWLALKDIKILSTRLGSFNKFAKIYEDIPFNPQLFL